MVVKWFHLCIPWPLIAHFIRFAVNPPVSETDKISCQSLLLMMIVSTVIEQQQYVIHRQSILSIECWNVTEAPNKPNRSVTNGCNLNKMENVIFFFSGYWSQVNLPKTLCLNQVLNKCKLCLINWAVHQYVGFAMPFLGPCRNYLLLRHQNCISVGVVR